MGEQPEGGVLGKRKEAPQLLDNEIAALLDQRRAARAAKDYDTADRLREQLRESSVDVRDQDGIWRLADGRVGSLATSAVNEAGGLAVIALDDEGEIEPLVAQRESFRHQKDWQAADEVREVLKTKHGVRISDSEKVWRADDGRVGLVRRAGEKGAAISDVQLNALLVARERMRTEKRFDEADRIRLILRAASVTLQDNTRSWSTSDGRSGAFPPASGAALPGAMAGGLGAFGMAGAMGMAGGNYGGTYQTFGAMPDVYTLLLQREQARAAHNWAVSDSLREQIRSLGITTDDKAKTFTWPDGRQEAMPGAAPPTAPAAVPGWPSAASGSSGSDDASILTLIQQREQAREARNWAVSDALRAQLRAIGGEVDDKAKTFTYPDGRTAATPTLAAGASTSVAAAPEFAVAPAWVAAAATADGGAYVLGLLHQREQARAQRNWPVSDRVREQLRALGVTTDDTNKTFTWPDGRQGAMPVQ